MHAFFHFFSGMLMILIPGIFGWIYIATPLLDIVKYDIQVKMLTDIQEFSLMDEKEKQKLLDFFWIKTDPPCYLYEEPRKILDHTIPQKPYRCVFQDKVFACVDAWKNHAEDFRENPRKYIVYGKNIFERGFCTSIVNTLKGKCVCVHDPEQKRLVPASVFDYFDFVLSDHLMPVDDVRKRLANLGEENSLAQQIATELIIIFHWSGDEDIIRSVMKKILKPSLLPNYNTTKEDWGKVIRELEKQAEDRLMEKDWPFSLEIMKNLKERIKNFPEKYRKFHEEAMQFVEERVAAIEEQANEQQSVVQIELHESQEL